MNSYRRCQIIKSDEVFVKERIMQFLYASLVPFHYRFASLLFIPVPRFSCCLDRVKNYATNFSIFFEIVPPPLDQRGRGWPPVRVDSVSIFMIWLIIIPCLLPISPVIFNRTRLERPYIHNLFFFLPLPPILLAVIIIRDYHYWNIVLWRKKIFLIFLLSRKNLTFVTYSLRGSWKFVKSFFATRLENLTLVTWS